MSPYINGTRHLASPDHQLLQQLTASISKSSDVFGKLDINDLLSNLVALWVKCRLCPCTFTGSLIRLYVTVNKQLPKHFATGIWIVDNGFEWFTRDSPLHNTIVFCDCFQWHKFGSHGRTNVHCFFAFHFSKWNPVTAVGFNECKLFRTGTWKIICDDRYKQIYFWISCLLAGNVRAF